MRRVLLIIRRARCQEELHRQMELHPEQLDREELPAVKREDQQP